jgi:hypothetical protein
MEGMLVHKCQFAVLENRKLRRCMMKNKDTVKYFDEVIVSENLLDELSKHISEDCVQRAGEKEIFKWHRAAPA